MRTPSSSSQTNPNEEPASSGPSGGSTSAGSNSGLSVLNAMSRSVDGHLGLGGFTHGPASSTRKEREASLDPELGGPSKSFEAFRALACAQKKASFVTYQHACGSKKVCRLCD